MPRDRNGEFDPALVPKHQRRLGGFNDLICGLMSRGMSTRDICDQMAETYEVSISPGLVSKITDAIMPEVRAWLTRPLDACYPIVYMDAIVVKVRTDGRVINRPCYIALGIDLEGYKHVLGLWLGDGNEGAKCWLQVCTEIRNRARGRSACLEVALATWMLVSAVCSPGAEPEAKHRRGWDETMPQRRVVG